MIWKESAGANWKHYPGIYLKGVRKTTEKLSQDSRCPGRDSNLTHPEKESGALPLHQAARSYVILESLKLKECN
jgi:hypothetical protein